MQSSGKETTQKPCVATIGTFDGVHRGHQFIVRQMVNQARERGLDAVVLTFPNHPLQVLREDFQPQMLTLSGEKEKHLLEMGVDRVVMVEFTKDLAQMKAHEFMRVMLKERLNVQVLMMGYDNHFGHDHHSFADYQCYGRELGMEVVGCNELASEQRISSTAIRQALFQGEVEIAHHLLGYHYALQGEVVQGFQNGRKLGYPTANLQVEPCKLIPENGAYLVSTPYGYGMLNIGTRPTLHNGRQRSIEVHIFDFNGDLYGQKLTVELLHHLRKEQEFDTVDALQRQLLSDEAQCRQLLNTQLSTQSMKYAL